MNSILKKEVNIFQILATISETESGILSSDKPMENPTITRILIEITVSSMAVVKFNVMALTAL